MSSGQVHATEHTAEIEAPAAAVYGLIADVTCWPYVFGPTVHAEVIDTDGASERIRIWAMANGEVKTWTSRRELDAGNRRISFRQEVSQPPVGGMGGQWWVVPRSEQQSTVLLAHDYCAVGDRAEDVAWIAQAVDHNSSAELAALKATAEHLAGHESATLSFEDSVTIQGSAEDVYDFLRDAQRWPERLPHVARLDLREPSPNLQVMAMDTVTKDGSVHTTESIRVCFPQHSIVYKQTKVPALMSAHTGRWVITTGADGVLASSHHTVVLKPDAVPEILGETATLQDARRFVRGALGANSSATLGYAKAYAESRSHG
jgi:ribosome-associated toxin RatA of RatAB toxin-antitoxin module